MDENGIKTIAIKVTTQEYWLIKQAAQKDGVTRAVFAQRATLDRAEKTVGVPGGTDEPTG